MVEFKKRLIGEGAEAEVWQISNDFCEKIRLQKSYRIESLDFKLRKLRTRREFKVLSFLFEGGVNVPNVENLFISKNKVSFTFDYLGEEILKFNLTEDLLFLAFEEIIKMHKLDVIHGDLTTLNMIIFNKKVFLIDFGLASFTNKIESKAVDLNLFFNSIKNEHPKFYNFKKELLNKYLGEIKNANEILIRLGKIEHRGRNK